jgi:hypothetical protein
VKQIAFLYPAFIKAHLFFITALVFCVFSESNAQNHQRIDSLKRELHRPGIADSSKISVLEEIGYNLIGSFPEAARAYFF